MSVVNRKSSRRIWLVSDWLLWAGSYRSPVKRDMTTADPAAAHSQAGLSGRKLHLSSVIRLRTLKDSKKHSCYSYCYRFCRRFLSAAGLARWDLHAKQSISSRLTQLGRLRNILYFSVKRHHGFHHPCEDCALDITMSVCDVYRRWKTIKAIFIAGYGCN